MASYTKEHHQNLNIERVASRSLPDTVRGYYAFKLLIWGWRKLHFELTDRYDRRLTAANNAPSRFKLPCFDQVIWAEFERSVDVWPHTTTANSD